MAIQYTILYTEGARTYMLQHAKSLLEDVLVVV